MSCRLGADLRVLSDAVGWCGVISQLLIRVDGVQTEPCPPLLKPRALLASSVRGREVPRVFLKIGDLCQSREVFIKIDAVDKTPALKFLSLSFVADNGREYGSWRIFFFILDHMGAYFWSCW